MEFCNLKSNEQWRQYYFVHTTNCISVRKFFTYATIIFQLKYNPSAPSEKQSKNQQKKNRIYVLCISIHMKQWYIYFFNSRDKLVIYPQFYFTNNLKSDSTITRIQVNLLKGLKFYFCNYKFVIVIDPRKNIDNTTK